MFVNLVWAPKLANMPPCYVFLIQMIDGNCIFSHSLAKLANMVQDKKVDKHTPPSRGGLSLQSRWHAGRVPPRQSIQDDPAPWFQL